MRVRGAPLPQLQPRAGDRHARYRHLHRLPYHLRRRCCRIRDANAQREAHRHLLFSHRSSSLRGQRSRHHRQIPARLRRVARQEPRQGLARHHQWRHLVIGRHLYSARRLNPKPRHVKPQEDSLIQSKRLFD